MVISFKVIKEMWKKLFDKPSPQINCAHHYKGDPAYAEHEQLVFLKCIKCGKAKNVLT
jgi:hypothetical protein